MPSLPPRPAAGLGGVGLLPKPAAPTAPAAAEQPAAEAKPATGGLPALPPRPAKPAGGLGGLPPRGGAAPGPSAPAAAAPTPAAAASTSAPSALPSLPPRPAAGGPSLPPRPTPATAAPSLPGACRPALAASCMRRKRRHQPAPLRASMKRFPSWRHASGTYIGCAHNPACLSSTRSACRCGRLYLYHCIDSELTQWQMSLPPRSAPRRAPSGRAARRSAACC